jgi:CheY-like chemotaxis protein
MNRNIFSFGIFTLYELYVLFIILFRNPIDRQYYKLWHLLVNLLYNFLGVGTCLYFCLNAQKISLTAIMKINKTIESWKRMMDNISTPIAIIESNSIVYKNKQCEAIYTPINQPTIDEIFTRALDKASDLNVVIGGRKYNVSKESVFFCDKPSMLFTLHDITSVIKTEEDKFTQRLVATVTHELRNPLSVMLSTYDILGNTASKEQKEVIRKGVIAGKMQESLINDILDVAKINNHKLILCPASTNLKESVVEIIDMLQFKINKAKIELTCRIDDNFPEAIDIDDRRFKQIIINLLSNSIKFTKVGKITLCLKMSANLIVCQVVDTGVGIPPDEQSLIFERFGMAKSSISMNKSGTGLGLHLCKSLIEAMNGSIGFHSEPNKLTTFEFIIPIAAGSKALDETNSSKDYLIPMENAPQLSVLHIDDDQLSVYALKSFSKQLGLIDHSYCSANDALKDLEGKRMPISLAFIDINMPEMSGYDVARKIRQLGYETCSLVALTGEDRSSICAQCHKCGFNDVIEKPLSYLKYKQAIDLANFIIPEQIALTIQNPIK